MSEVAIDSKTVLVPADAGGFVVCEANAGRSPTKYRRSLTAYPSEGDALRAVLAEKVSFGPWRQL